MIIEAASPPPSHPAILGVSVTDDSHDPMATLSVTRRGAQVEEFAEQLDALKAEHGVEDAGHTTGGGTVELEFTHHDEAALRAFLKQAVDLAREHNLYRADWLMTAAEMRQQDDDVAQEDVWFELAQQHGVTEEEQTEAMRAAGLPTTWNTHAEQMAIYDYGAASPVKRDGWSISDVGLYLALLARGLIDARGKPV